MSLLCLPSKQPKYRVDRSHSSFLIKLKDVGLFDNMSEFEEEVVEKLRRWFSVHMLTPEALLSECENFTESSSHVMDLNS